MNVLQQPLRLSRPSWFTTARAVLNRFRGRPGSGCAIAVVMSCVVAAAEVEVRFDGNGWVRPAGVDAITSDVAADGVCFAAPASLPLEKLMEAGVPNELVTFPVRFSLVGQEGEGARLDPLVPGKDRASKVLLVVVDGKKLTITGVPVAKLDPPTGLPAHVAWMDADFNGLGDFLEVIEAEVGAAQNRGEMPRAVLVGRSGTSFGLVVRTLQLLRSQGCCSGVVKLDDAFPDLSVEVAPDSEVSAPICRRRRESW